MTGGVHAGALGFDAVAAAYERGRPTYPAEAVDALVEALGVDSGSTVIELGAGTGKFTRLLAPRVGRLVAVEPLAGMRAAFAAVEPAPPLVGGVAEAIPLRSEVADAVVAAQAFHWFETERSLAEIRRALHRGGALGLVWNRRDESVPWVAALGALLAPYEASTPREYRRLWQRPDWGALGFTPLEETHFTFGHELDADGLVDRVVSISFIAALDEVEKAEVVRRVRDLVAGFAERFELPYRTGIHWCRRR